MERKNHKSHQKKNQRSISIGPPSPIDLAILHRPYGSYTQVCACFDPQCCIGFFSIICGVPEIVSMILPHHPKVDNKKHLGHIFIVKPILNPSRYCHILKHCETHGPKFFVEIPRGWVSSWSSLMKPVASQTSAMCGDGERTSGQQKMWGWHMISKQNHGSVHTKNWLVVWNMFLFIFFHICWNNHPNWLSYFSEGLKPPTRKWT